jgi:two-component system response regulator GlrR
MDNEVTHILIVDDEVQLLELLRMEFEENNVRVTTAESVDEAISAIENEKPFLVLSDLKMPVKSGKELLDYIKSNHPDIHFLFMSGHTEKGDAQIEEAEYFFEKPFSLQTVVDQVLKIHQEKAS